MSFSRVLPRPEYYLYDITQDGVIVLDMDGIIRYANKAIEDIIGLSLSSIIDKDCNIIHEDPDFNFKEVVRKLSMQAGFIDNMRCKKTSGHKRITTSFSFLTDFNGNPTGILLVLKNNLLDTSEEKEFLLKQNHLLRSFNFRTDEICLVYDLINWRNIYCTDTIEHILGWTATEFRNGGWAFGLATTHPDDRDFMTNQYLKEIEKRKDIKADLDQVGIITEYRKKHKNGSWKWIRSQSYVLDRTREGKISHMIIFLKDVSLEKLKSSNANNANVVELIHGGVERIHLEGLRMNQEGLSLKILTLSLREKEILSLLKLGMSTKQMASKIGLTINTVNTYRKNLMQKLHAKNTAELIKIAMEHHIE